MTEAPYQEGVAKTGTWYWLYSFLCHCAHRGRESREGVELSVRKPLDSPLPANS